MFNANVNFLSLANKDILFAGDTSKCINVYDARMPEESRQLQQASKHGNNVPSLAPVIQIKNDAMVNTL